MRAVLHYTNGMYYLSIGLLLSLLLVAGTCFTLLGQLNESGSCTHVMEH